MRLQQTDGWVAGWLLSLYLDELNDCLFMIFAVCTCDTTPSLGCVWLWVLSVLCCR